MPLVALTERCAELYEKCFGRAPRWVVAAPGRVNLIGEHTDYNEGFVLPMAVDHYTVMAADRVPGTEVTVVSETTGETATFSARPGLVRGDPPWSNYIRGVVNEYQKLGRKIRGFNAVVHSDVPFGGGCASSAALEVAAATLLECMQGPPLPPIDKALLCQRAEHAFAGVPCGIMDQFTSVLAQKDHALLLDCRTHQTTLVPMTDPGIAVLIINTNVRHKLADSEYAKRRSQCETAACILGVPALRDATPEMLSAAKGKMPPEVFRRARHVISENQRTLDAAKAIQGADWNEVGRLMYASHASLRDDYEVSCRELDAVVEIAKSLGPANGMIGCRMTGGGFGGCAVSLAQAGKVKLLTRKIDEAYEAKTGNHAFIFSSRPGSGARVLRPAPSGAPGMQ